MTWSFLPLLTFLVATLSVAAGYTVVTELLRRDARRTRRRLESEFPKPGDRPPTTLFKTLDQIQLGEAGRLGAAHTAPIPAAIGLRQRLQTLLDQSGLMLTLRQLLGLTLLAAVGAGSLGVPLLGPWLSIPLVFLGAAAPLVYVRWRRDGRRRLFQTQLPGAFDLMARVLRAGQSVPQAFQAVADTFDQPIAGEFAQCQEQQNLGMLPELTLRDLARRTGVLEARIFVMAMLIQQQTGGNLSEVLERLAGLMRERVRIRSHIRALTAEGRLQAVVLLVLPPLMLVVMRFINRRYADILFDHWGLLAAMSVSMAVGALWIRKIVNFDI